MQNQDTSNVNSSSNPLPPPQNKRGRKPKMVYRPELSEEQKQNLLQDPQYQAIYVLRELEEEANLLKHLHSKISSQIESLRIEEAVLEKLKESCDKYGSIESNEMQQYLFKLVDQFELLKGNTHLQNNPALLSQALALNTSMSGVASNVDSTSQNTTQITSTTQAPNTSAQSFTDLLLNGTNIPQNILKTILQGVPEELMNQTKAGADDFDEADPESIFEKDRMRTLSKVKEEPEDNDINYPSLRFPKASLNDEEDESEEEYEEYEDDEDGTDAISMEMQRILQEHSHKFSSNGKK